MEKNLKDLALKQDVTFEEYGSLLEAQGLPSSKDYFPEIEKLYAFTVAFGFVVILITGQSGSCQGDLTGDHCIYDESGKLVSCQQMGQGNYPNSQ